MYHLMNRNKILRAPEGGDAGASAGAAGTGSEKPWYEPLDSETKGYVQTRGLDKKTPVEAFTETYKAHREAEKFIGAPANELLRLPKETNSPEWEKVYQRLGKPADKKDYDLSVVKRAGDKAVDDALADTIRQAAFDTNMSKEGAARLAANVVKYLDDIDAAAALSNTDKLAAEKKILETNWGANAPANMVVAQAAVRALGVDPQAVVALEKVVGYAKVMEMFRDIGSKIGEARFVGGGQGSSEVMTRDQAVAEKEALKRDQAWVKRYLARGVEEMRKMDALDRIIVGVK